MLLPIPMSHRRERDTQDTDLQVLAPVALAQGKQIQLPVPPLFLEGRGSCLTQHDCQTLTIGSPFSTTSSAVVTPATHFHRCPLRHYLRPDPRPVRHLNHGPGSPAWLRSRPGCSTVPRTRLRSRACRSPAIRCSARSRHTHFGPGSGHHRWLGIGHPSGSSSLSASLRRLSCSLDVALPSSILSSWPSSRRRNVSVCRLHRSVSPASGSTRCRTRVTLLTQRPEPPSSTERADSVLPSELGSMRRPTPS